MRGIDDGVDVDAPPAYVRAAPVSPSERGALPFMRVAELADVVRAVRKGSYEFHTWGASFPRLERPDRITLGLEPDPQLPWSAVQAAAHAVHALLDSLDLAAFVKTTGGSGLHVVVPLTRRHTWGAVASLARGIALHLGRRMPALFTAADDSRRGRVYVDCERNVEGATAIAAYSLRARGSLPVSMPLAWNDLGGDDVRARFDIDSAEAAVAGRRTDPWAEYERSRRTLSASMHRALSA